MQLTFTRFTLDSEHKLCADGRRLQEPVLFEPAEKHTGITRRGLAMWLYTSPEPGAGDFEWIDIGDKLACVIVRYRGAVEIEEVKARALEVLALGIAIEVTRDRGFVEDPSMPLGMPT
jgi:hypothetical protein